MHGMAFHRIVQYGACAMKVHPADIGGGRRASASAASMACLAPAPFGAGEDMCQASERAPPSKATCPESTPRCIRNTTAASPMLMPARWTENGWQRVSEIAPSEEKP